MLKKQLQELRDNLSNNIFCATTLTIDDVELPVQAPKGMTNSDELYVDKCGNISYAVSYNRKTNMVSLHGNLENEDGTLAKIMSFAVEEFDLTRIVDFFVKCIVC